MQTCSSSSTANPSKTAAMIQLVDGEEPHSIQHHLWEAEQICGQEKK
jgi:hypothetical protein